jgi:PEP-CTERM motif
VIGNDLNNNNNFGASLGGGFDKAQDGSVQDLNGDGRGDLGSPQGSVAHVGPPDPAPWWVRPNSGGAPTYALTSAAGKFLTGSVGAGNTLNARTEVIGYFAVTIPGYLSSGATPTNSLAYNPILGPSSITFNYGWFDVTSSGTTGHAGLLSQTAGDDNVLQGGGVTFQAFVPEPGTFVLLGLGGVGLVFGSRRIRHARRYAPSQCPAR